MYDNDVELSEVPAKLSDNHNKRKRDLRKLNSAGSTDSDEISEASSNASLSCDQPGESPEATRQILLTNIDASVFTDPGVTVRLKNEFPKFASSGINPGIFRMSLKPCCESTIHPSRSSTSRVSHELVPTCTLFSLLLLPRVISMDCSLGLRC
jgi:hypothetical protein